MTIAEDLDLKREQLERFIGNRLVSIALYTVSHDAAETLDKIVRERRCIMEEVNQTFGLKR